MIDGVLFDKLVNNCLNFQCVLLTDIKESIAQTLRGSGRPFGGIQVVHIMSIILQEAYIIVSSYYVVTFANCHPFQTVTNTETLYRRSSLLRQTVGVGVSSVLLC